MKVPLHSILLASSLGLLTVYGKIDRQAIVSRYNPTRNASNPVTPMQVGNGFFAFGADVTSLQSLLPYATMASWGYKNDTLPPGTNQTDVDNYKGASLLNHGRPVEYDFGGGNPIEQYLTANPNNQHLGAIGLVFWSPTGEVQVVDEDALENKIQELDLWTGVMTSNFDYLGEHITVQTACAQESDTVGITITSKLFDKGTLGLFLDFPWNDGSKKFSAPFVGTFNNTANHTTTLNTKHTKDFDAQITHHIDTATILVSLAGDAIDITRDSPDAHRYSIRPSKKISSLSLSLNFRLNGSIALVVPSPSNVFKSSVQGWEQYWSKSGFVDLYTGSSDPRADELQRRIILSRYLMRVNEASDHPPQESGLVNLGWYGKFHMEMYFWHCMHWGLWDNWDLLHRSSDIYQRFLPSSITRSQVQQGWPAGARWPKMTDPTGRSAPGEINNLLIWEQVHPLVFATYEYRAFPTKATLEKWADIVTETADWMAAFAWFNQSTNVYDIGPPMYVVSEDTNPNVTQNPAFELSYWHYGFDLASQWMNHMGREVPSSWTTVDKNLAKLPIINGTYAVYEGIETNYLTDPTFTSNHPALVGVYGWLPATRGLNISMAKATMETVWAHWNFTDCWGWDFPMLAMSAARNGEPEKAVEWLLHPVFAFDDVGMPSGGVQVPFPYFPAAGSLLLGIAHMVAGWDGSTGHAPGFPKEGWNVQFEGLSKAL